MSDVKYIVHYDKDENEGRGFALSAKNKVDYIIKAITEIGYDVEIISASVISSKGNIKGSHTVLSDNVCLTKLPALKHGNLLQKIMAALWSRIALTGYLLTHIKKSDKIIAYH